jgi:hypothetical protein
MIHWENVQDFVSACKIISFMSFEEYEWILHTREKKIIEHCKVPARKVWYLKGAIRRHLDLKKFDVIRGHNRHRKAITEKQIIGSEKAYYEYYVGDKKICGSNLKGYKKDVRCNRSAGEGTLHFGHGFCKEHEMSASLEVRNDIWLQIRETHKEAVSTLGDIILRSEIIQKTVGDNMESDISYLEIARQGLMKRAEQKGGIDREMSNDLAFISDTMSKIKERKVKTEQMNWIEPAKVGAMILQVLEAVTKNEAPEVRQRIAMNASRLTNIVVPEMSKNVDIKPWERSKEVVTALKTAEKYAEDFEFGSIPEVTGYEIEEPKKPKIPNYLKHKDFNKTKKTS